MSPLDYNRQMITNLEFLHSDKRLSIITRRCCGGECEALVVDSGNVAGPLNILFRSVHSHFDFAIRGLHWMTAEAIGQRYDIVDGHLSARSIQPTEGTVTDPQDDSDWHHVQPTPTESEDARNSTNEEANVGGGQKASTGDILPSSEAADGGRRVSAEVAASPGDPVLNRDAMAEGGGLDLGQGKVLEKGDGEQPTNTGDENVAASEVMLDTFVSTGKKKGRKGKKGNASRLPPPPPPPPPLAEDQFNFNDIKLGGAQNVASDESFDDATREEFIALGSGTWGGSWGTGNWDFSGILPTTVDASGAGKKGSGNVKRKSGKGKKKAAAATEVEIAMDLEPAAVGGDIRSGRVIAASEKDGKEEGLVGEIPEIPEPVGGMQVSAAALIPAEEDSWGARGGGVVEEKPIPVQGKQEPILEPEPEPVPVEENSWDTWGRLSSSKKGKKKCAKKGIIEEDLTPVQEKQEPILEPEPEPVPIGKDGWPVWGMTFSKKGKKGKKGGEKYVEEGTVEDDPMPEEEGRETVPVPTEENFSWGSCGGTSRRDNESKEKGVIEGIPMSVEEGGEVVSVAEPIPKPGPVLPSSDNEWVPPMSKKDKKKKKKNIDEVFEKVSAPEDELEPVPAGEGFSWTSWGGTSKRDKESKEKRVIEGIPTSVEEGGEIVSVAEPIPEPAAESTKESSWGAWGTIPKKGKERNKEGVVGEVDGAAPVPEPTLVLDDEISWGSWGTRSKKGKKNKKGGIAEEVLVPADEPVPVPDPAPVLNDEYSWNSWGTTSKKVKKNKKEWIFEEVDEPVQVPEPEPATTEESSWNSWGTTSKKDKKNKKGIVVEVDEPVPVPVSEPVLTEESSWNTWGTSSKKDKKNKKGIVVEVDEPVQVPEPEPATTEEPSRNSWGTTSKKDKKNKKKRIDEEVQISTDEPVPVPEPEPSTTEVPSWNSWETTSKKDKKNKKKRIDEEVQIPTDEPVPEPEPEPVLTDESLWNTWGTSSKKDKKNKKGVVVEVDEPVPVPVPEPVLTEESSWNTWGTSSKKDKKDKKNKKKGVVVEKLAPLEEEQEVAAVPEPIPEPTTVPAEESSSSGWGGTSKKNKKIKKGIVEWAPAFVEEKQEPIAESGPAVATRLEHPAPGDVNGENLEKKDCDDDIWSFWEKSRRSKAAYPPLPTAPTPPPHPAPAPPSKIFALLKIANTPPGHSSSVFVTLETPVSQTALIRHAAVHTYNTTPAHYRRLSLQRMERYGEVRAIVMDGNEVGLRVDDEGLGRALGMVLEKGEVPTLVLDLNG